MKGERERERWGGKGWKERRKIERKARVFGNDWDNTGKGKRREEAEGK